MTTPITKEQELRAFITGFLTDPAHDEHSENSMTAQVFRIALASMDAEPIYQIWDDGKWVDFGESLWRELYDENRKSQFRIVYAAPPAPVVPDEVISAIENLKRTLVNCNRYNYCSDAVKRIENACRGAMLNHSENERDMVEPVSQPYKLPATRFQQVADLYEMQFDDGRTCAFHTDAEKAVQWLHACDGNKVQEYVKLERLQDALTGNSPVIPDGWQLVPKRLTAENGAKGALSGEFSETKFINCPECFGDEDCETCDGSGRIEISVPVSWTTIKAIWAKGVEHFSEAPQQEGE